MAESSSQSPSKGSSKREAASTKNSKNSRSRGRRLVNSVGDEVIAFMKNDIDKTRLMAFDAIKSQAYLYPFKGVFYFLRHRALWKPLLSQLGPYAALSIIVTMTMFFLTYLPQLAVLMFINGPLAIFTTIVLVLNESSAIIDFVSRTFLLGNGLLDTFDATLISRNQVEIVSQGRAIRAGRNPMDKLGRVIKSPVDSLRPGALLRFLIYLPLNLIPFFGTIIFICLQGKTRGRVCHDRYFQLRNWSSSQKSSWLETHEGSYTSFGISAAFLELVPIVSMFFALTNTVGAALWAADIEDHASAMTSETAPRLRQKAEDAARDS